MARLTWEQRQHYYQREARRTGVHLPLLVALHHCQQSPPLGDGEVGLGIGAIHDLLPHQLDSFPQQVHYAANTLRWLLEMLMDQHWSSGDLWQVNEGGYGPRFLERIAQGYEPPLQARAVGRLGGCDLADLLAIYREERATLYERYGLPYPLSGAEQPLLAAIDQIPLHYRGLPHQREAILEGIRIWRHLDRREEVLQALEEESNLGPHALTWEQCDRLLPEVIKRMPLYYNGFPHQREALLRVVQGWQRLPAREAAIRWLLETGGAIGDLSPLDPALIAFVQRLPQSYRGEGHQRQALTETVRLWRDLPSRTAALASLGLDPQQLQQTNLHQAEDLGQKLDQALIAFCRRLPQVYQETPPQREALIQLVQGWQRQATRAETIADLEQELCAWSDRPYPKPLGRSWEDSPRPDRWTPDNLQLAMAIVPQGHFTWAEATRGGLRRPGDQTTIDRLVAFAQQLEEVRDRLGQPLIIVSWYRPPQIAPDLTGIDTHHHVGGDGVDFLCPQWLGKQIYWLLDPWWPGGLGRYRAYPHLCHLDARPYRARWCL